MMIKLIEKAESSNLYPVDLDFLRLGKEPGRHYDEATIHSTLMSCTVDFMNQLERFYAAWALHRDLVKLPKKLIFESKGIKGDWRVMPCVIERFEGELIKAVKVIGTNEEERIIKDKICVGKALLIDEFDNHVKASFDVCALSSFRTAAISALAYKYCRGFSGSGVGIIGAGRIGFYLSEILRSWLGVQDFSYQDLDQSRAKALADRFSGTAGDIDTVLSNNRAVFLCTDSTTPILNGQNSKPLQFISSVGADAGNLSELEESLLDSFEVLSESRHNIEVGDMSQWKRKGLLCEGGITELADIIGGRRKPPENTLFISTGTAVQDALVCHFIDRVATR